MRVGFNIKATAEMQSDVAMFNDMIRGMFVKQQKHLVMKKSIRVLKWNMRIGHDGDDFIRNMITVVFTGNGYRIPRIIKRFYK